MTREEGKALLRIARSAIETHLGQKVPSLPETLGPGVLEKRGVFVSLHQKGGELRGCIGRLEPNEPLARTVFEIAVAAAFRDPRFSPLRKEELGEIGLEISVLSPLKKNQKIDTVVIGREGLLIRKGEASGVLLPQVATENRWSPEEFLRQTCKKAGLPEGAWKEAETEIYTFTAEIFSEEAFRA